jgi:hypothetical protein
LCYNSNDLPTGGILGNHPSPKSFRFSSEGFLQFHSGYGDTSFSIDYTPWKYVRTDVTVQRVNYAYFSNNGSDIEMNSNLFRLGSLNMKNIVLLSVTSSPNTFDYKISIPGTTKYVQFLNKFSVDNNLGGLVLKEDGVYSNVTGGLTPLLTKYSAITTKYTNNLGYTSVILDPSNANRRFVMTMAEDFQFVFISLILKTRDNNYPYYSGAMVAAGATQKVMVLPSITVTEAGEAPAVYVNSTGPRNITIWGAWLTGYYTYVSSVVWVRALQ